MLRDIKSRSLLKTSASLDSQVDSLLNGYQWQSIDPGSDELVFKPDDMAFVSKHPIPYSYRKGSKSPFKGNCVEQSLFVKDHFPDAKILYSRVAKPGINCIHATPLFNDDGYYRHIRCFPEPGRDSVKHYLTGKRFTDLNRFLKSRAAMWHDDNIDFYVLDNIPESGDSWTLQQYADANAKPIRVRNGKILNPDKSPYRSNFKKIVDRYKDRLGIDLSHISYYTDTLPRYSEGQYADTPEYVSGGDWHNDHSVRLHPKPEKAMEYYGVKGSKKKFVDALIAHELAHDIEANPKYKKLRKQMIEEAKKKGFETPYTKTVKPNQYDMELFCEYMSHLVNQKKASLDPAVAKLVDEVGTIDTYYAPERTQTIRDILKSKGTNCWGVSRLALNRLRKAGLDPETVFIYEDEGNMLPTHQFTTFRDGDKYRVHDYWFNNRKQIGKAFKSREKAIDDRVKRWRSEENHYDPVHVYTGTTLPPIGYRPEEYMGAIMMCNKLLKSYPKIDKEASYTSGDRLMKRCLQDYLNGRNIYKAAGLDNYWMKVNPELKDSYGLGFIDDPKFTSDYPISQFGFRGKEFNDLVRLATKHKYSLYGNNYVGKGGDTPNWLTNQDCRRIYNRLKNLSPEQLKKWRASAGSKYYIPQDDKDIQRFVEQFKKHVAAGHSLAASY